jgi:hypothetical protein
MEDISMVKRAASAPAPVRVNGVTAAQTLGISYPTMQRLLRRGVLTPIYPDGPGKGKRVYLDVRELELYGRGEMAQLREYQAAKLRAERLAAERLRRLSARTRKKYGRRAAYSPPGEVGPTRASHCVGVVESRSAQPDAGLYAGRQGRIK